MAGQSSRCGNVGASVRLVLDSGILVEKLRKQGPGRTAATPGAYISPNPLFLPFDTVRKRLL